MRRLVPWALIVVVGFGAGVGAALGAVGSPGSPGRAGASAGQWISAVVAATEAAGTAHLDYSEVTNSPNPDLRGSSAGSGVVDFAAGTFRVTDVTHQTVWSTGPGRQIHPFAEAISQGEIAIGPAVYLTFAPARFAGWSKESFPRNESALGLGSAVGFADALSSLTPPYTVLGVRDLGPASLGGATTTRYLVRSEVRLRCPKSATQPSTPVQRTTLWIDGQGRLVQARNADYSNGKIPATIVKTNPLLADRPMGSTTRVTTLRISSFGRPVHIAAPAAVTNPGSGSAFALQLKCAT